MHSFLTFGTTEIFGLVVYPMKIVGWLGAAIFGARFIIQWLASEKAKKSVIPFGFWECSALGSLLLIIYFMYKKESVGLMQTLLPFPIYLRNIYFRYTHKTPKHPGNEPRPAENSGADS